MAGSFLGTKHLEPLTHGNLRYPPPKLRFPQEIAGLIFRDYENPWVSLNKALLLGPAISWGKRSFGGGQLGFP